MFLAAAETICFGESSVFLPCSALAVNERFSSVERKHASGQTEELQDAVSQSVHWRAAGLTSFEHKVLFGYLASWF